MRALPVVTYRGSPYFFDEKLSELRHVRYPWQNIALKDYEVLWIRSTGRCPGDLTHGWRRGTRRDRKT